MWFVRFQPDKLFADVVETFLADSHRDGSDPEKPFSGKITVRVPPVLHRRVAIKAAALKESMNKYFEDSMVCDTLGIEDFY
jgi:predicted HicB family RNase H-like nuclease